MDADTSHLYRGKKREGDRERARNLTHEHREEERRRDTHFTHYILRVENIGKNLKGTD